MDITVVITTLIGAICGGGLVSLLLWKAQARKLNAEADKTTAEAEKITAEAEKITAEGESISVATLCQTIKEQNGRIDSLDSELKAEAAERKELQKTVGILQDEITRERTFRLSLQEQVGLLLDERRALHAGVKMLIEQMCAANISPAWTPPEFTVIAPLTPPPTGRNARKRSGM